MISPLAMMRARRCVATIQPCDCMWIASESFMGPEHKASRARETHMGRNENRIGSPHIRNPVRSARVDFVQPDIGTSQFPKSWAKYRIRLTYRFARRYRLRHQGVYTSACPADLRRSHGRPRTQLKQTGPSSSKSTPKYAARRRL